jgi:hypothetical protein
MVSRRWATGTVGALSVRTATTPSTTCTASGPTTLMPGTSHHSRIASTRLIASASPRSSVMDRAPSTDDRSANGQDRRRGHHRPTRGHVERRTAEGLTKRDHPLPQRLRRARDLQQPPRRDEQRSKEFDASTHASVARDGLLIDLVSLTPRLHRSKADPTSSRLTATDVVQPRQGSPSHDGHGADVHLSRHR